MAFEPNALSVFVKPLSNVIKEKGLSYAKKIYFTGKMKQYESAYPDTDSIPEYAYGKFAFVIEVAFGVHTIQTIEKLLRCTQNHSEFEAYLLELGGNYKYKPENSDEEDTFKSLIRDCVEVTYQEKNLKNWASLLKEHEKSVIEIDQHNEIRNKQDEYHKETMDAISAMHTDFKESKMTERKHEEPVLAEIIDQNKKYIDSYNEALFLEDDEYFKPEYKANGEKKARLNSVFVLPELNYDGNNCNLEKTLYNWRFNTGEDEDLDDAKIFLLYGKAGDGKTSLVSHILAKNILGEKCHAIALRNHLDTLAPEASGKEPNYWRILKDCFKDKEEPNTPALKDKEFSGKVLILDGLDEVCVLRQHFNGNTFIRGLMSDAPSDVKILITSRNGNYFEDVGSGSAVTTGTLKWTEGKVKAWCDAYKAVHACRAEWCDELPGKLKSKEEKFRNALSTPIILYICCVRNIDISTENSIAGIYDEAFKKIGLRKFNENTKFEDADRKQHEVNWQYTKELAFQMFLNGKLEEVVAVDGMNDFAKERTRTILREKHETDAYEKIEPEFKKYFAVCPFVSKKGERGVEFAHKTVGEYFTAVKLYEDYFGKLFQNGENTSDETVWTTIFQAFRYQSIPEDIIDYLVDITEKDNNNAWKEKLFRSFHEGMTEQYWWKNLDVEPDYEADSFMLTSQVYQAFANLTWYFTKLGFAEYDREHYEYSWEFTAVIGSFFSNSMPYICCSDWKCLRDTDLRGADLRHADLSGAYLSGAYLSRANLSDADLRGAKLIDADLSGANLIDADLNGADLNDASLRRIILLESDLPKWTEPLRKANKKLINPIVIDDETYKQITDRIYNPETNRMEYPKDKPKGD